MDSTTHPFNILPLFFFLLFSSCFISFAQSKIPGLKISPKSFQKEPAESLISNSNSNLKTFFFNQNLDHFTYIPESYITFRQRYVIYSKYWGGTKTNAPIFAYLGAESKIDGELDSIGFLRDNAFRFKALLVYIEHRYYGKSMPFGSAEEALKNASTLGYFNSAQAIADYAAILLHIKNKLSAIDSPIIVIGGSYGGMLAAWFRLKYPHIAVGALASSAPLLYFGEIPPKIGYYSIVTKVYKEASENCYQTIRKSWSEIDSVASKPGGLAILGKKFKTCAPLKTSFDLKDYLDSIYGESVQYNRPPTNFVNRICGAINKAPKETYILGRIFAGVVAYFGDKSCYDMNEFTRPTNDFLGWKWQTCSELVLRVGHDREDTMFQTAPFDLTSYVEGCKALYGVSPRPYWVTTYYGGRVYGDKMPDFKLILRRFGSNIIFSNGLKDPYSVGSVLENISDSIIAITTQNGSHCVDITPRKEDPEWMVIQREKEVNIIEGWISKYYKDLKKLKDKTHI